MTFFLFSLPRKIRTLIYLGCLCLLSCQQVFPARGTSSADAPKKWSALLNRISSDSGVDYKLLRENRSILDNYMSWIAKHGPHTEHYSIREEKRKIVFYANAYNAAVLFAVLEHWPISSVKEVDAGWFTQENIGFFLGQLFVIDGGTMSLYHLEQDLLLSQFQDPRIHAMLNCASIGCPPVRYWYKKDFNQQLDQHWKQFIQNNVRQNGHQWEASELFFWYERDLVGWSEAQNLCAYLAPYLHAQAKDWMEKHVEDCGLSSFPYDWALNDSSDKNR